MLCLMHRRSSCLNAIIIDFNSKRFSAFIWPCEALTATQKYFLDIQNVVTMFQEWKLFRVLLKCKSFNLLENIRKDNQNSAKHNDKGSTRKQKPVK